MKEIPLTRGFVAFVDDEDYARLSDYSWSAVKEHSTFYAIRTDRSGGDKKTIRMHRDVVGAPAGVQIDHINCNGLDNQKNNLRQATHGQNMQNRRPFSRSGYKGVSPSKKKWVARIGIKGKRYLGTFASAPEAARAYDKATLIYYGAFAHLNFPPKSPIGYVQPGQKSSHAFVTHRRPHERNP